MDIFCLTASLWDILDKERMCLYVILDAVCPPTSARFLDFRGFDAVALHPDRGHLYRALDRFRPCMRLIDFQKNDILTRTGMKRVRFVNCWRRRRKRCSLLPRVFLNKKRSNR